MQLEFVGEAEQFIDYFEGTATGPTNVFHRIMEHVPHPVIWKFLDILKRGKERLCKHLVAIHPLRKDADIEIVITE